MRLSLGLACVFGPRFGTSSLAGEYETTTRYTQRTTKQHCPPFSGIANAKYSCLDDELTHGSECTVSCDDGYSNGAPEGISRSCSCFTARSIILLPKPCEWEGSEFPTCELEEGLVLPTCPSLPEFANGLWQCTSDTMTDGESCYSICNEGFQLEENHVKFSRFDCACSGSAVDGDATCLWKQRNAILNIAERKFPKRVVSPLMQRSLGSGQENNWDMSIFRSGTAILPNCLAIETTVETNDGEIVDKAQCPSIPVIDNGMLVCASENYIGSICKLVCDDNYLSHGYGDKNRVKCVKNSGLGIYEWNKNLTDFTCLDADNGNDLEGIEYEECVDPRGPTEEEQAAFPGYFTCDTTVPGHYVLGEACDLTCFPGYTYANNKRTHKLCHCKKGNCFWKFDDRTNCVADEEILKSFGIFQDFMNIDSSSGQIAFAESRLGGKEEKILALRKQLQEVQDESMASKMQRSLQKSTEKQERLTNREEGKADRKADRIEMRTSKMAQAECSPLPFDPETARPPRCTGSTPGAQCTFMCKKGFKIQGPTRSYCACNKRGKCDWSHRSECA